jgi:hypothetical protein
MNRSRTYVTKTIDFGAAPPVGTVLMRDGQKYELVNLQKHVRQDGRTTALLIWRTHCAECAAPFDVTTGLKTTGAINRRCPLHHKPGRAVAEAGRKRQQKFWSHQRHARRRR